MNNFTYNDMLLAFAFGILVMALAVAWDLILRRRRGSVTFRTSNDLNDHDQARRDEVLGDVIGDVHEQGRVCSELIWKGGATPGSRRQVRMMQVVDVIKIMERRQSRECHIYSAFGTPPVIVGPLTITATDNTKGRETDVDN